MVSIPRNRQSIDIAVQSDGYDSVHIMISPDHGPVVREASSCAQSFKKAAVDAD